MQGRRKKRNKIDNQIRASYFKDFNEGLPEGADYRQINLNDYHQRFVLSGKPIMKVVINFDTDKGNVEDWTIEQSEEST